MTADRLYRYNAYSRFPLKLQSRCRWCRPTDALCCLQTKCCRLPALPKHPAAQRWIRHSGSRRHSRRSRYSRLMPQGYSWHPKWEVRWRHCTKWRNSPRLPPGLSPRNRPPAWMSLHPRNPFPPRLGPQLPPLPHGVSPRYLPPASKTAPPLSPPHGPLFCRCPFVSSR